MALDKAKLEQAVLALLKSLDVPREVPVAELREKWSKAYHGYAKDGVAGAGGKPTLQKALVGSKLTGGTFLPEISAGIEAYWTAAAWTPDGTFSYATANASGLAGILSPELESNKSPSTTTETAAKRITKALHSYTTKMVKVTATNLQSGATAPVLVA